jgi:hypothetical protein
MAIFGGSSHVFSLTKQEIHVARWRQRHNPDGKASHHDGRAVVQGESRHTTSSLALQARKVNR